MRWLYWEPETKLLDEKRAEYFPHVFDGNIFLFTTGRTRKDIIEPALATRLLNDLNCMDSGARGFPLYLHRATRELFEQDNPNEFKLNMSEAALNYLRQIEASGEELFYYCLSILHSLAYRRENTSAIRSDWPRVPLPAGAEALRASAALGRQVAALLDPETPVPGVTSGSIRPELRAVGSVSRVGGGPLQPSAGELDLTAGWGHAGQGGVTMPGKGRALLRHYTAAELAALESMPTARALLGEQTYDIFLNGVAFWQNIPQRVWEYTIGGYQVIKKWLSYREKPLLGRSLTVDEVRDVTAIARLSPPSCCSHRNLMLTTIQSRWSSSSNHS